MSRKKFVVKRSEWYRGKGWSYSALFRRSDGKKCCLGFCAIQLCEATEKQIEGLGSPHSTVNRCNDPLTWPAGFIVGAGTYDNPLFKTNSALVCNIISVNDDLYIDEPQRESELTKLFAQLNIDVEFVE